MKIAILLAAVLTAAQPAHAQPSGRPAWEEDFGALDQKQWEIQLYSFPANGCNMIPSQVAAQNGQLRLSVDRNTNSRLPKGCNAGEVGSYRYFTYGLFVVRMKAPAVKGGVSAFFLMNKWQPSDWEHKEIDIELLGGHTDRVQLTTHDFQNGGRDWKSAPATLPLGFDFSSGFHDYGILWTPHRVDWFVDGRRIHSESRYVPNEPLQIRMNIYLGDPNEPGVAQWVGPRDDKSLPASAEYDWIRYYPLDSLPAGFRG